MTHHHHPPSPSPSPKPVSDMDRDCAIFARAALFPEQIHRDSAHPYHFPALAALDRMRHNLLTQTMYSNHPSSLFPRGVLLVRNLANENNLQWNGQPKINPHNASFDVIPQVLTIQCTSECEQLTQQINQTAVVVLQSNQTKNLDTTTTSNSNNSGTVTVVLCTDRLLQRDYQQPLDAVVAKELPIRTYQSIEETLAHQITKIAAAAAATTSVLSDPTTMTNTAMDTTTASTTNTNTTTTLDQMARIEIEAAAAAECYYSGRHKYGKQIQIRQGSHLPTGYSIVPSFVQLGWQNQCLRHVATKNLLLQQKQQEVEEKVSVHEINKAVQQAMNERCHCSSSSTTSTDCGSDSLPRNSNNN